MIVPGLPAGEDDLDEFDPLAQGAAAPPPVVGGGCLARFDPQELNEESGVEYFPDSDTM